MEVDKRNLQNRRLKQRLKSKRGRGGHSTDGAGAPCRFVQVEESSDDQYSKRSISSNWSYYDEEELNEENEQVHAANFSEVLQRERHVEKFVFEVEKCWENDQGIFDTTSTKNYFDLNVQLLNIGLHTIPFYKRLDYDKLLFSKHQIKRMTATALKGEDVYQAALSKHEEATAAAAHRISSAESAKFKQEPELHVIPNPPEVVVAPERNDEKDEELDEILNMTAESVKNLSVSANSANPDPEQKPDELLPNDAPAETEAQNKTAEFKNTEDVQNWLDDILKE